MNNKYYIYEWFNVNTGIVFYVGKGKGIRRNIISNRNKYFTNYYNKYKCNNRIVISNLTEQEAFNKEIEIIQQYKSIGQCFCNITNGGEQPPTCYGSRNGMYGRPWWDENTPKEKIEEWKKGLSRKGKQNGQYGISPKERMNEETYKLWREKHKTSLSGEKNPQYGKSFYKRMNEETYKLWREKHSKAQLGGKNTTAKKIELFDCDKNLIEVFDCMKYCCEYLIKNGEAPISKAKNINNQINNIRTNINKAVNEKKLYLNHYFNIIK